MSAYLCLQALGLQGQVIGISVRLCLQFLISFGEFVAVCDAYFKGNSYDKSITVISLQTGMAKHFVYSPKLLHCQLHMNEILIC